MATSGGDDASAVDFDGIGIDGTGPAEHEAAGVQDGPSSRLPMSSLKRRKQHGRA